MSTCQGEGRGFGIPSSAHNGRAGLSVQAHAPAKNPVNEVIAAPSSRLGSFYASYPYDMTRTTDNDPFFYHFARFGTVISNYFHSLSSVNREKAVGERVLILLLAVSILAAAAFLLLPFVAVRREWRRLPRKGLSAVFFAGVGFGFIFFEITLMQLLNLFLGFPTSSLTDTLMASSCSRAWGLSSASGCPDRPSPGHPRAAGSGRRLFYLFGLTPLTNALLSPPLAVRILITLVVLAPLGLCLGMLMPLGLGEISRLGDLPRAYVAWGWAVNGFASVVGSVLATILAMSFG